MAPVYSITDLGTLPGVASSGGYGINSSGEIAGTSTTAFFWSLNSGLKNIGTLPGGASS